MPADVRRYLDTHWHLLPAEFCRAWREKWAAHSGTADAGRRPLAALRTVWDGREWLDFCAWFEQGQITQIGSTTDGEYPV